MANTSPRDVLQPALLDRLIDDAPQRATESREERVLTRSRLRACVLRDLGWLFGTTAPAPEFNSDDKIHRMSDWPHVTHTVINYGLPPLAGKVASGLDVSRIERALHEAILDFEPRILPNSLRVRGFCSKDMPGHQHVISFEISGDLWAQPYPLELLIKTDLDLESGEMRLSETQ